MFQKSVFLDETDILISIYSEMLSSKNKCPVDEIFRAKHPLRLLAELTKTLYQLARFQSHGKPIIASEHSL